jgi:hypothetical protein
MEVLDSFRKSYDTHRMDTVTVPYKRPSIHSPRKTKSIGLSSMMAPCVFSYRVAHVIWVSIPLYIRVIESNFDPLIIGYLKSVLARDAKRLRMPVVFVWFGPGSLVKICQ